VEASSFQQALSFSFMMGDSAEIGQSSSATLNQLQVGFLKAAVGLLNPPVLAQLGDSQKKDEERIFIIYINLP
jgi:hypothetical protein